MASEFGRGSVAIKNDQKGLQHVATTCNYMQLHATTAHAQQIASKSAAHLNFGSKVESHAEVHYARRMPMMCRSVPSLMTLMSKFTCSASICWI